MILENFPHVPGVHCSSSSIADVLRYDGQEVPEAWIFGLGSGLGFLYSDDPAFAPVHRFNGRSLALEENFYELVGAPIVWEGAWSEQRLAAMIESGRPVLAQTDIAYLPYYQPVHFPLHGIVVAGLEGDEAHVADTYSRSLQRLPLEMLRDAIEGQGSPFMSPWHYAPAPKVLLGWDPDLVMRSLERTIRDMLHPARPRMMGIPAMRRLAATRDAWSAGPDWSFRARFAYQSIEKRGTGGGGFRHLYATFLDDAADLLPELVPLNAAERMRASAREWTALALDLKAASVEDDPARLEGASARLGRIADLEERLMADLERLPAG